MNRQTIFSLGIGSADGLTHGRAEIATADGQFFIDEKAVSLQDVRTLWATVETSLPDGDDSNAFRDQVNAALS